MTGSARAPSTPSAPARERRARALRTLRRARRTAAPVLIALLGAVVGILLAPPTSVDVGPVTATVHLRPSLDPRTVILLPPVGEVAFDTHQAPVTVEARVQSVDIRRAEELLRSDTALADLEATAPDAITGAAVRNAATTALLAALGAATATGLTYRRTRRAIIAAGGAAGLVGASCGLVAATFDTRALAQPRFEGLLSQAAYVADIGTATAADYSSYRRTLAEFVGQVSALYVAADSLPSAGDAPQDLITVLHVSDIHDNPQAYDVIRQLIGQFPVDAVIDTGDIVSWGTSWENQQLAVIGTLGVPYVFIAGNHDGQAAIETVAAQPNAVVLSNEVQEVAGLRIAGIGDPRFAADDDSDAGGFAEGKDAVDATARQLGDTIVEHDAAHPDAPVDIALLHDPTQPEGLEGRVPLVLSGHMHTPEVQLDRDGSGTDWMVSGSTGGALASGGVRPVLDGGDPLDLTARLLHIDPATHRVVAYDDITMGGLGLVSVSIERHRMPEETEPLVTPSPEPSPSQEATEPAPSAPPGEVVPDDQRVTDPAAPTAPVGVVDPDATQEPSPAAPATSGP